MSDIRLQILLFDLLFIHIFKVLILTCQISVREDKGGVYCHPVTRNNMLPPGNYYPVISDYLAQH